MHFNVLKGDYPGLSQLDETLPIKAGETGIARGSVLVNDAGSFRRCLASDHASAGHAGAMAFFSFQAQADPDVVMANGITAQPCFAPCEVETDMYVAGQGLVAGAYLMTTGTAPATNLGKLALHTTGCTAVGLITKAPYTRWSNVATPAGGSYPSARQGALINVIAFWSCFLPNLAL